MSLFCLAVPEPVEGKKGLAQIDQSIYIITPELSFYGMVKKEFVNELLFFTSLYLLAKTRGCLVIRQPSVLRSG